MSLVQGQVGPQVDGDGATPNLRLEKTGGLIVVDGHARYQESVYRGNVFVAANQAAQALSTALNTTQTGFTLTNPAGSGKNLVLIEACIALASAPAGISDLIWAANVNPAAAAVTQTSPLTVRNALLGAAASAVGLAASAVTLPAAPVVVRPVGGGPVATGSVTAPFIRDEIAGALAIAPGCCVSLSALTTAISVLCSVTWEEIPV